MHSSIITTTFAFCLCANAANINLEVQPGLCNIYEKSPFLNTSQIATQDTIIEEPLNLEAPKPSEQPQVSEAPKPKKRKKLSTRWTTKPSCISDELGQEFCVFTNANFANGRGISFFTTPTIAENVKDLPAFSEPGVHDNVNDFSDPPWEVRNVPGRGNGLFATKKLERGDLIMAATPLGIYGSDAFYPDYMQVPQYKFLRKTYEQLPEESKKLFMGTAAHNVGDIVMERINTNAIGGEFEGMKHFFMYPEIALMNHDCRPNIMYYLNASTLIHSAHASRTINPGEELTITYTNLLQSHQDRQEVLKMIWGFDCTCKLCSSSELRKARTDRTIEKIKELHKTLSDWTSKSTATPKLAEELISLYEKEHLHAAFGTGHMFAALAWNAVGQTGNAIESAKKALEMGMVSSDKAEEDEESMKLLIAGPKAHWSFMKRGKMY